MKKSLLFAGLVGMMLASCSQEEVISVNQGINPDNVLTFRVRSKSASRSLEFSSDNLQEFKIFGYLGWIDEQYEAGTGVTSFFDNGEAVTFTRNDDGVFTSATPYFYPGDGTILNFIAYAPSTLSVQEMPYAGLKLDYTVNSDITKQEDIIFAESAYDNETAVTDGDLELDFKHALAKVYISELRSKNENFKIEVAGVKFGNVYASGESLFCGEKGLTWDKQNEVFNEDDDYIADGDGRIFWKPTGEQTESFVYLLDAPVVLDKTNTSVAIMSGDDAGNTTNKEAFMMIPQQLKAGVVDGKITTFEQGDSYIAFLVRITTTAGDRLVYPFAEGVEDITEEIDGVQYAWAAFPVSSLWVPGLYVDYMVDFSNGAGYVAPGAAEELEFKPIIGGEVKFTSKVWDWNAGTMDNITHDNEINVDVADQEDPFGE